jgi:hypothetical protein
VFLALLALCLYVYFLYHKNQLIFQRDNQRVKIATKINDEIQNFYNQNLRYPNSIDMRFSPKIEDKSIDNIALSIHERFNPSESNTSSELGSLYCYKLVENGYVFGVKLESNEWKSFGAANCEDADVPQSFKNLN